MCVCVCVCVCMSLRGISHSNTLVISRDRGLAVSLFRLLSERHPNSMATLHEQYRMNR